MNKIFSTKKKKKKKKTKLRIQNYRFKIFKCFQIKVQIGSLKYVQVA